MAQFKQFTVEIPVRFTDLDAYGHVNNAVFFTYLEHARIRILEGEFNPSMQSEPVFLVRSASCLYISPIPMRDTVTVEVQVETLKRMSVTLNYRITDGDGLLYAEASTVLVSFDPIAKRPVGIPNWFIALITDTEGSADS
ncbi:MAG: acyl-CoA thioesterase [Spirochaetia bacterium]